jgi:CheY-like chemotaxis protein
MSAPADVPCRCLIAEPDPFIASLLLRFAEGSGLACVQAQASDDVVDLARQLKPAVIIIDAELPGDRVGWEIMRALKLNEATCHIALISCSWLSELEVRSLVDGLDGHLQKPDFPYNDFERVLRTTGVLTVARKDTGRPNVSRPSDAADQLSLDLPT